MEEPKLKLLGKTKQKKKTKTKKTKPNQKPSKRLYLKDNFS